MRRTTNRTKQIIVLAGITYIAYVLYKNGQNSESYYEEEREVEDKSIEQLEKEMNIAVEKEQYEKAAILRDKIKEKNENN